MALPSASLGTQTDILPMNKKSHLLLFSFFAFISLNAQTARTTNIPRVPAQTQQTVLPSHGSMLLGVFYLAAGAGPHPTAVIFHGFPGYEQNLDLAQTMRAHGWNVLAMHYRGSWGVKGGFSFQHCTEDADAEVRFLIEPANAHKYRIDTRRILVIGHSMGGYMAASSAAHNPQIAGVVLISAWNIGADYDSLNQNGSKRSTIKDEAKSLGEDGNLLPLSGTNNESLALEIYDHQSQLNFVNLAPRISPRPVFVITANDGLAPTDHALVEALHKAGDSRVTERHWNTDHSYSGERFELASAVLKWAETNLPK